MRKQNFLLYLIVITIPVFLSLIVFQSTRYQNLNSEIIRLEQTQTEWVESNKRLIAGIAEYSSAERINDIAKNQLDLQRIQPEYLLQVRITEGKGHEY
ncbi:MAG: cell division protein FtsL [Treponema sp.]|nr:cell division protein FtsL [Treponema sp.]